MMKKPTPPDPSLATVSPALNVRSLNVEARESSSLRSRSAKRGTRSSCSTEAGTGSNSNRVRRRWEGQLPPPLRELLDLSLGCVQLAPAERIQLLSALPEGDGLVEPGLAALELLDDLLQLSLSRLERELVAAHERVFSTRAPKPPSASSTSTASPGESADAARTIPSPARTIA